MKIQGVKFCSAAMMFCACAAAMAQQSVIVATRVSGPYLVISGGNGQPGGTYYVLSSTNVPLALRQWAQVATNVLGASGNFTITVTNTLTPSTPGFVV